MSITARRLRRCPRQSPFAASVDHRGFRRRRQPARARSPFAAIADPRRHGRGGAVELKRSYREAVLALPAAAEEFARFCPKVVDCGRGGGKLLLAA